MIYIVLSHTKFGYASLNITHINGIRTPFTLNSRMSTHNPIRLWGLPMPNLNYLNDSATSGMV